MPEHIDKYCERVLMGLWDEPLNITSNIAYLVAGVLLVLAYRKFLLSQYADKTEISSGYPWDIFGLIALLFVISLGSSLWHIYAEKWSLYADAISILAFINLYILSCLYRILRYSYYQIAALFFFYHLLNYSLQQYFDKDFLNGSIFYLPTWLYITGIGLVLLRSHNALSARFVRISILFAIALLFRTIDLAVCNPFSLGTHFIWHLISAYMMYLLVHLLIVNQTQFSRRNVPL